MSWLTDVLAGVVSVAQKLVPVAAQITIGSDVVTAGKIEVATGSLGSFFTAMQTAVRTKNIESGVEVSIEELVMIASDLGLGEPFTGVAKTVLPLVFGQFNTLAAMPLVAIDDGKKGYVTSNWVHDPREQLDADGDFKN